MASLEAYKYAADNIREFLDSYKHDPDADDYDDYIEPYSIADSGKNVIFEFDFEGKHYGIFLREFTYVRHYDDVWHYVQLEEGDEFYLVQNGYYDSWNGTEWQNEFFVARKRVIEAFVFNRV
jgi:hypothetical protein